MWPAFIIASPHQGGAEEFLGIFVRCFACRSAPYGVLRCQMRYCMRGILLVLAAGLAGAQTMTEVGASAAGGAIGSAAGKKVSEGITAIFGQVDKAAGKAAKPPED